MFLALKLRTRFRVLAAQLPLKKGEALDLYKAYFSLKKQYNVVYNEYFFCLVVKGDFFSFEVFPSGLVKTASNASTKELERALNKLWRELKKFVVK